MCFAGSSGVGCATKSCPHNCGGNAGTCANGVCICNEGWGGEYCLERLCPGGPRTGLGRGLGSPGPGAISGCNFLHNVHAEHDHE